LAAFLFPCAWHPNTIDFEGQTERLVGPEKLAPVRRDADHDRRAGEPRLGSPHLGMIRGIG
jgi:hypothetical protein